MKRRDPDADKGRLDALRKAFSEEEQVRDAAFDEQVKRLLGHLDSFERGERDRPST